MNFQIGDIVRPLNSVVYGDIRAIVMRGGEIEDCLVALPDPESPGSFKVYKFPPAMLRPMDADRLSDTEPGPEAA